MTRLRTLDCVQQVLFAAILSSSAGSLFFKPSEASTSCSLDDVGQRHRRLASIKTQILTKLRLTEAPDVIASWEEVPPNVKTLYHATQRRQEFIARKKIEEGLPGNDEREYYGKHASLLSVRGEVGKTKLLYSTRKSFVFCVIAR